MTALLSQTWQYVVESMSSRVGNEYDDMEQSSSNIEEVVAGFLVSGSKE